MRKVFKEDFAIHKSGININRIDWVNSVGKNIRFIYDDIEGIIIINNYENPNITISYQNQIFTMHISQFRKCQLGSLLNVYNKNYLYNIGDIINNNEILEQIRIKQGNSTSKGYKYKCLIDGYIGKCTEVSMKSLNCPVCSNAVVLQGVNDIATTHPEYLPYIVNIKDSYKYTKSSGKQIKFKCKDCGNQKTMKISTFHNNGIMCNKCGDGRSYPEKFVFNLLKQLNLDFIPEKIFKWANKRYDFYIVISNSIIEVMCNHHYGKGFNFCGGRTLKEEQENDKIKIHLAYKNGITDYIIIEARISDLDYMKNSILESKLSQLYNLDNINWLECHKFALSNRVKEACELWMNGLKDTLKISKEMKIGRSQIWKYLKMGSKLNWCDYDSKWYIEDTRKRTKKIRSKRVEIFKNNESLGMFESVAELSRQSENIVGVKLLPSKISQVCNGKAKTHKRYTFKYV